MLVFFCKWLSKLPLGCVHRLGAVIGRLSWHLDQKSTGIAIENIHQSGLCKDKAAVQQLAKDSRIEAGKSLMESLFIWGAPQSGLLPLVKATTGWHLVEAAQRAGKGLIFLTPHLGCFEITSIYYGSQHPITVLYRPPKLTWLEGLLQEGRQKGQVALAPANAAGVKKLLQALKRGEAIGILPDQIPRNGEGEWADFFGKPAYTMGLASKLAVKSGATVIMAFGERLPAGEGFHIHLSKVEDIQTPALLNQAIERQVSQCPVQYLWQYNRYKQRRYAMQKLQLKQSGMEDKH
ncbi:lysophospholipid acyltransferase family protein [Methylophilus glucosoxydans]|uniref:Lysophospholipid acyltransferase family protein n=1 Tax=Methylophilus glucosoxydans TaxID=752553 RepID=A0ABW3GJX2_9PROT